MIVRSAAKSVSKTWRKPMRRSAAATLPVTFVPGGQAEEVAQGHADGGRGLRHEVLLPLLEGLHHLLHRAHLVQGAGGAGQRALAAVHAGGLAEVHLEGRAAPWCRSRAG